MAIGLRASGAEGGFAAGSKRTWGAGSDVLAAGRWMIGDCGLAGL